MNEPQVLRSLTPRGWVMFVKLSFCAAIMAMLVGIFFMPVDFWVKAI